MLECSSAASKYARWSAIRSSCRAATRRGNSPSAVCSREAGRAVVLALMAMGASATPLCAQKTPAPAAQPPRAQPDDSVTIRIVNTELHTAMQLIGPYLDRPLIVSGPPGPSITLETPHPIARCDVPRLLRSCSTARTTSWSTTASATSIAFGRASRCVPRQSRRRPHQLRRGHRSGRRSCSSFHSSTPARATWRRPSTSSLAAAHPTARFAPMLGSGHARRRAARVSDPQPPRAIAGDHRRDRRPIGDDERRPDNRPRHAHEQSSHSRQSQRLQAHSSRRRANRRTAATGADRSDDRRGANQSQLQLWHRRIR